MVLQFFLGVVVGAVFLWQGHSFNKVQQIGFGFKLHKNSYSTNKLQAVGKKYSDIIEYLRDDAPKVKQLVQTLDIATNEDFQVIETMVKVADWRKADDITVLNLQGLSDFTNFMVIMEATSKPQNQAICSAIEETISEKHSISCKKQGDIASGWILLDYGSIIVHVMHPKVRSFYKLEKKWKEAEIVNISNLLGLQEFVASKKSSVGGEGEEGDEEAVDVEEVAEDEDPFWSI